MKQQHVSRSNAPAILILLAAALLSPAAKAELFISEYVEGSGFNKAIEIYNPGLDTIDLSSYELQLYSNGNPVPGVVEALSGTIGPGEAYVVANAQSSAAILAVADRVSGVAEFNGNDVVALLNGGAFVDVIGQIGVDPGLEWSSGGVGTQNETLRRKGVLCVGDTDFSDPFLPDAQWDGFPQDSFDGLGTHSVSCGVAPGPPLT